MRSVNQIFFIAIGSTVFVDKENPVKKKIEGCKLILRDMKEKIFYKIDGKYIESEKVYSSYDAAKKSKSDLLEFIRKEKTFKYTELYLFLLGYKELVTFVLEDNRETHGTISEAMIEIDKETVCVLYKVKSLISYKEWDGLMEHQLKGFS